MNSKYVLISGLAFDEEEDMEKLSRYAADGWILEKISGGVFFKLKKDKPQNIIYSLDYQKGADNEYFDMFNAAGWKHVLTTGDEMHIFSAPAGTKPIYSDRESEAEKYENSRKSAGIGTIITLILGMIMWVVLNKWTGIKLVTTILILLFIIDVMIFSMCFIVYLAFVGRTTKKQGASKLINTFFILLFGAIGITFVGWGIRSVIFKSNFGWVLIIIGILELYISLDFCKKCSRQLK